MSRRPLSLLRAALGALDDRTLAAAEEFSRSSALAVGDPNHAPRPAGSRVGFGLSSVGEDDLQGHDSDGENMLSRAAQEFADEIRNHDWSDSPWRLDRAGHQRSMDKGKASAEQLDVRETDNVRTNVMWVTAQVLLYADPNLDVHEFAEACGVPTRILFNSDGRRSRGIPNGLRISHGRVAKPGTWDFDDELDEGPAQ